MNTINFHNEIVGMLLFCSDSVTILRSSRDTKYKKNKVQIFCVDFKNVVPYFERRTEVTIVLANISRNFSDCKQSNISLTCDIQFDVQ
jgi:hypothetical protein